MSCNSGCEYRFQDLGCQLGCVILVRFQNAVKLAVWQDVRPNPAGSGLHLDLRLRADDIAALRACLGPVMPVANCQLHFCDDIEGSYRRVPPLRSDHVQQADIQQSAGYGGLSPQCPVNPVVVCQLPLQMCGPSMPVWSIVPIFQARSGRDREQSPSKKPLDHRPISVRPTGGALIPDLDALLWLIDPRIRSAKECLS